MEDVLSVYHAPYDPYYPVVCMDETCKQLIGEVEEPIPAAPGRAARIDYEYIRNGVAQIFLEVEPLGGRRHVEASEHRTRVDWAHWIKGMLEERYPEATKVRLVLDNLNTHSAASLYEAFEPEEARRLAERIEFHHTPKRGSWLNIAECEFSALSMQCLNRRIPTIVDLQTQLTAWQTDRNTRQSKVNWQFTTTDARIRLRHLYPKI